jgi:hypothetical protein
VKRDAATFFVLPGHEDESVERIVERTERYVLVWKPILSGDGAV